MNINVWLLNMSDQGYESLTGPWVDAAGICSSIYKGFLRRNYLIL